MQKTVKGKEEYELISRLNFEHDEVRRLGEVSASGQKDKPIFMLVNRIRFFLLPNSVNLKKTGAGYDWFKKNFDEIQNSCSSPVDTISFFDTADFYGHQKGILCAPTEVWCRELVSNSDNPPKFHSATLDEFWDDQELLDNDFLFSSLKMENWFSEYCHSLFNYWYNIN